MTRTSVRSTSVYDERESQIEPCDTLHVIAAPLEIVSLKINGDTEDEFEANDCSAHPRVLTIVANRSVGADCKGKRRKAISEGENRP